jgi:hypothetical protein
MRYATHMPTHPALLSTCVYCGNDADALDHVFPQSNELLVAACWECNSAARDRTWPSFTEKATYLLRRATRTGRVKWKILLETAPIVQDHLDRAQTGSDSAPASAAKLHTAARSVRNSRTSEPYIHGIPKSHRLQYTYRRSTQPKVARRNRHNS